MKQIKSAKELVKTRKDLIFIVNPLLILGGILLFCYAADVIIAYFQAFWIVTACALALIVTPLGNQRLSNNTNDVAQRLPILRWFFYILVLELVMLGVYCGINLINGELLSIHGSIHSHLFVNTLHTQLLRNGLFPWNIYALIAVGMGILAYRQQTNGYFSQLAKLFDRQNPQGAWSLLVNTAAQRLTLFACSSTLLFMTLFFISLISSVKVHLITGFQTGTLLVTLILLILTFTQTTKQTINRIFSKHIPTGLGFPVFCISLAFILLILSILAAGVTQQIAAQTPPFYITQLMHFNATTQHIFSTLWWLCFTPLVCGFITRISKGYQIRVVLIGVLIVPILISLFFVCVDHGYFSMIHCSETVTKIIAMVSFLILLPMLINHQNTTNASLSYFPKNGITKHLDEQAFFQKITQLTIILLYFYLVVGTNAITLFIFAPTCVSLLAIIITPFSTLKNCYRTRRQAPLCHDGE